MQIFFHFFFIFPKKKYTTTFTSIYKWGGGVKNNVKKC